MAVLVAPSASQGVVTVHKKSSVSKPSDEGTSSTSNSLATAAGVLNMVLPTVKGVLELKKQSQELSADCMPNGYDVEVVNDLVKEWAKIGDTKAEDARKSIADSECVGDENTWGDYKAAMTVDHEKACWVAFADSECKDVSDSKVTTKFKENSYIWCGYPKAATATIDKKNYSNVYDVFSKIPFGTADYTKDEISKVRGLIEKTERCAPGKISQKKRELWAGFLTKTIGSVGTATGVSSITDVMQMASQLSSSGGGFSSMLNNVGNMVPAMLDR